MFDDKLELESFHVFSFKVHKGKVGCILIINIPFESILINSHDIWSGEQNVIGIFANKERVDNFLILKHQQVLDK